MNKYTLIATLAASSFMFCSCSDESDSSKNNAERLEAPAKKAALDTPAALVNEMFRQMEIMAEAMENSNSSNADAQAAKIVEAVNQMRILIALEEEMDKVNPGCTSLDNNQEWKDRLAAASGRLMQAAMKVGMESFYGSAAMQQAFEELESLDTDD